MIKNTSLAYRWLRSRSKTATDDYHRQTVRNPEKCLQEFPKTSKTRPWTTVLWDRLGHESGTGILVLLHKKKDFDQKAVPLFFKKTFAIMTYRFGFRIAEQKRNVWRRMQAATAGASTIKVSNAAEGPARSRRKVQLRMWVWATVKSVSEVRRTWTTANLWFLYFFDITRF